MNKRNITGFLAVACLAGFFSAFADETLTITTYYPSPQGVYKKLRLYPSAAGSVGACNLANEGFMYYDNSTHSVNVCTNSSGAFGYQPVPGSGGFWDLNGANLNVTNSTWNVSARNFVGTAAPTDSGQFRAVSSTYGTILRQDGASFYILNTNVSDSYGSWSNNRPVTVNNTNGDVYLASGYSGGSGNVYLVANNAAGRVGIGTGTSGAKLDVNGNATVRLDLTANGIKNDYFYSYPGTTGQPMRFSSVGVFSLVTDSNNDDSWGAFTFYKHAENNANILMTVQENNRVGINNPSPSYALDVTGQIHSNAGVCSTSDERLKKNVQKLKDVLYKIKGMDGVSYEWKSEDFPEMKFPAGRNIGFIAQNVGKYFPELVSIDGQGYQSVRYQEFVAVLLEAVKEQQGQIEQLYQENKAFAERLEKLERVVNK